MSIYTVQLQELKPVPLAVIRRTASARELSRVIPECCGLVWDVVSAQQRRGGRHVAVYWDGAIRLEVGVELRGSFADQGEVVRSATPGGLVATVTHFGPYSGLGAAHGAVRTGAKPTSTASRVRTGRSTGTGKTPGTPIPHRFAPMCSTKWLPRLPNKRLKLAGGDRFKGNGVLCPSGHGLFVQRPCAGGRVARSLSAIR